MIQFGYILLGLGAYLVASEFKKPETDKGQDNEQGNSDQDGTGSNRRRADHGARGTRAENHRTGSVDHGQVSEHGNGDVSGGSAGNHRGGEPDSAPGHRETQSVINIPTKEAGATHESETGNDHGGGNNGGDVRGEPSGGHESESPQDSERNGGD